MIADFESAVADGVGGEDCVARWVAEPICIFSRGVAEVVYFVGGIVGVDVEGYAGDGAVEIVRGVFDFPEPRGGLVGGVCVIGWGGLHSVAVESETNAVAQTVAHLVAIGGVVVTVRWCF